MDINLEELIDRNKKYSKISKVADYIPALAKANKNDIGISIIDKKSNMVNEGEYEKKFTIQSISKVFTLILAIIDNGKDFVFEKVGFEGTDEPFNTFYKLDFSHIQKPANPMINSGAILTTSLILDKNKGRYNRILNLIKKVSGNNKLKLNEEVYISEKITGDRNKAIAYIMKSKNMIEGDVENILDSYFKQCSIEVNTVDLANMAMFLANGCKGLDDYGKTNPKELTKIILSIMMNCGMYNYSSEFGFKVGIPSKSGVGGGILSVVPGKMGIGVYSPGLDENGNSLIGQKILEDLSKQFNLSIYL